MGEMQACRWYVVQVFVGLQVSNSRLPRFLSAFSQGGGGNEIVWIIGRASMYPCTKHVAN